jgi:hydrophobe/amphiphile efflux-3 (HAE3) family protein
MGKSAWERRLIDYIVRFRIAVIIAVLVASAVAAFYAQRLSFDSDVEIWFLEDDKSLKTYRNFLKQFEADEIEVIGIFAEEIFTPELISAIDHITQDAESAPYVHKVYSLTNAKIVDSKGAYYAYIGPLMEELPTTDEAARTMRKRALRNVLVRDHLVSGDGRATAIVVELDPEGNTFERKVEMVSALRSIVEKRLPKEIEWCNSGSPSLDDAFYRYSVKDFSILGPIAGFVILFVCLALYGVSWLALCPLLVVTLASLWIFGLMGFLGIKINVVSSSLLALTLAVGVADSIHVISDYLRELAAGLSRDEAIAHSAAQLLIPCFFTSATTAAGFLALLTSESGLIGQFGWLAASAVTFAFILTMTLLPALLKIIPKPKTTVIARDQKSLIAKLLVFLGKPTQKSSWVVLTLSGILFVVAGWSLTQLRVGANPLTYFRKGDVVRTNTYRIDKALGGGGSFDLYINTKPEGLKDPEILRRLETLEKALKSLPAVTQVLSILDSLRETKRVLTDGRPESAVLPDTREMAAQFYLMLEGDEEFRRYVKGDYQTTRMSARVRFSEAEKLTRDVGDLEGDLHDDYYDDELKVVATGYIKLMSEMEHYLLNSQIRSFVVAFFVISIMMFGLLRSVRLALFSMIPNLIPIALGLAFMVWVDIALDPGTVMIGCMAMGMVVDDTVHFMVRLRRNLQSTELQEAIALSMAQTGRPIILTSLILAAGFLTLIVSRFTPNMAFGLVSAVVVVLAMAADLILLPAALIIIRPKIDSEKRI